MKKIYLVLLLISSLLLTQCYTQKEYLTQDYSLEWGNKLIKVLLADSTEHYLGREKMYKFENDSTLIISALNPIKYDNYSSYNDVRDTLEIENIHSYFVSEINMPLTLFASIFGGGAILYGTLYILVAISMSN